MFATHRSDGLAVGLLDSINKHDALNKDTWDLCCIDEWDSSALGVQPGTMEELEESLDPHHFHITIRTIAAGTHEAKAVRHASTHTKHVLPLLAVARITSRPKSPGSGNSGPGVDDPWATDPWGPVAEDMRASNKQRDYDLFDRTPKFTTHDAALDLSTMSTMGNIATFGRTLQSQGSDATRHTFISPRASGLDSMPTPRGAAAAAAARDPAEVSFVRKMKEEVTPAGLVGGFLGPPLPARRPPPSKLLGASSPILKALWREVATKAYVAAAGPAAPPDDSGATHMLLIQQKGTPMYGSEMEDPELAQKVFLALKDVHRSVVHGDVNPSNIVWDPSGHFFQFVDLEFATWPGKVLVAPLDTLDTSAHDDDEESGEFHSIDLPHTPNSSRGHMPPSPLGRSKQHGSGSGAHGMHGMLAGTPPSASPGKAHRFSLRGSVEPDPGTPPFSIIASPVPPHRESSRSHGSGFRTPQGPRSHNDALSSPSARDPFPFVRTASSGGGGGGGAFGGGSSSALLPGVSSHHGSHPGAGPRSTPTGGGGIGGGFRPPALSVPRSPARSTQSGRLSTPAGGFGTPTGAISPFGGQNKMHAMDASPPLRGFATGTYARVVSDALVTWPLGPGAHGSTHVARLAPHGTLEYASFNQLKGCWPTAADDTISLFWTLVRCHCPQSLWWGGLPFAALCEDAVRRSSLPLPMHEEAALLAYAQVVYLTTDSPTVTLKRRRGGATAGVPPTFAASATVPFIPPTADAQLRWKHYLFRAFASRHVLALTAAAGTPAEHAALRAFHAALWGLLPRVCRSGGLGGAPVPMSEEDVLLVEEINRSLQRGQEPLSYSAFLDRLETVEKAQARIEAMREQNLPESSLPPPLLHSLEDAANASGAVCFHGMHELHTSTGQIVWLLGETEDAMQAQYALAMPPWRLGADKPPVLEPVSRPKTVHMADDDSDSASNSGALSGADSPPVGGGGSPTVKNVQMHARDEAAAQARWNTEGHNARECMARALRVAVAAPKPTAGAAPESPVENAWDATLTWLQGVCLFSISFFDFFWEYAAAT